MTQLLVSVRSPDEALAALAGGADLIDIKEPQHGSLGRADVATMQAIIAAVAGRAPVSAALGEWQERATLPIPLPAGLTWGKLGLAGARTPAELRRLPEFIVGAKPVVVAYADHHRADCLPPATLVDLAIELAAEVFLVDTFLKDGTTLLDWLPLTALRPLLATLRTHRIRCALAGSLREDHFATLAPLAPTWFAVRGAACGEGRRDATIEENRVRHLKELITRR